jgi:predicted flap endonuclease-1-like 5' DNA nuclease
MADRSPEDKEEPPKKRLRLQDGSADHTSSSSDALPDGRKHELMLEDKPELLALEDQVMAAIDPNAIQEHLPILGEGHEGDKDDFTKMRGIGRWIERRLNRIKIWKFQQLANMTPAIATDVAKAIRYFPGRIQNDLWVFQAEKLAAGKEWIVNPDFPRSGISQIITIEGKKYERELLDIARNYGKGGASLNMEHAECLWFSAMDGQTITTLERLTLRYIMDNFQLDQSARDFLTGKLKP